MDRAGNPEPTAPEAPLAGEETTRRRPSSCLERTNNTPATTPTSPRSGLTHGGTRQSMSHAGHAQKGWWAWWVGGVGTARGSHSSSHRLPALSPFQIALHPGAQRWSLPQQRCSRCRSQEAPQVSAGAIEIHAGDVCVGSLADVNGWPFPAETRHEAPPFKAHRAVKPTLAPGPRSPDRHQQQESEPQHSAAPNPDEGALPGSPKAAPQPEAAWARSHGFWRLRDWTHTARFNFLLATLFAQKGGADDPLEGTLSRFHRHHRVSFLSGVGTFLLDAPHGRLSGRLDTLTVLAAAPVSKSAIRSSYTNNHWRHRTGN